MEGPPSARSQLPGSYQASTRASLSPIPPHGCLQRGHLWHHWMVVGGGLETSVAFAAPPHIGDLAGTVLQSQPRAVSLTEGASDFRVTPCTCSGLPYSKEYL